MSIFSDFVGTTFGSWQLGIGGARLRSNSGTIEARLADNSALAPILGSQVKAASVSGVGTRQTVLSGSVDSNGVANALAIGSGLSVTLSAATVPYTIAFAAGFDQYGAVDYVGQFTSNQTFSSLTANSTLFLYIDRNTSTGALTLGFTAQGFTYALKAPSSPTTGFHWFDLSTFIMKQWNGSAWINVQHVIIGECVTGASTVTSVVNYAYRGFFSSLWSAVVANTVYTFNHNLGIQLASANPNLQIVTSTAGNDSDAVIANPSLFFSSSVYGYQFINNAVPTWKNLQIVTRDFVMLNTSNIWVTTGYYSLKISRGW